jgi:hypothetical protein
MADPIIAPLSSTSTSEDTNAGALVKQNPRGGFSVAGNVPLDPTENAKLLARMQEMVDQRQSPLNLLLGGLKDASAAVSGGLHGPSEAIARRDAQKMAEAQDLFRMRSDMAALRSAQGQQELLKKQYESVNPPAGAETTPTTPITGAAAASPIPGLTMQQINTVASNPSVKAELDTLAPNDYAGRLAVIREAAKSEFGAALKGKFEAAGNKQEPYTISGIGKNGGEGVVMLTPNEYLEFKATGKLPSGEVVPKAAVSTTTPTTTALTTSTTTATPTSDQPKYLNTSAAQIASKLGNTTGEFTPEEFNRLIGTESTNDPYAMNKESKAMGVAQFTPETLINLHKRGIKFDPLNPEQAKKVALNELNRLSKELGSKELALAAYGGFKDKDPTKYINGILTTTTKPATAVDEAPQLRDFPSKVAYDAAMKLYELKKAIPVEAAKTEATTFATETGKDLAQLKKDTERAILTNAAADRVIKLADDPKLNKVMGWMHGGNKAATYLGAIPSFAADVIGKGDKFEEKVKEVAWAGDKDLLAASEGLTTDAKQLGIEYTQQMFKGARLGIGLEKLGLQGKGVSEAYLPQVNKLYAQIAKDGADFEVKKNAAFEKWHGDDPMKTYGKFLSTPEYEKMIADERDLLTSRYPGMRVDVLPPPTGEKKTKSGVPYKVL